MKRLVAMTALIACWAGTGLAADFQMIGAMGMGGSGVARDMGAYATYWNPAGLAFAKKTYSTTMGIGAGARISEGLADNVDRLSKFTEGSPSILDSLENLNISADPQKTGQIVNLLEVIKDISVTKGTLSLSLDLGAGFQYKQFGLGVFMLSEGFGRVLGDVDPVTGQIRNILPASGGNALTSADLVTLSGTSSPTQTFFNRQQVAQISTALGNAGISSTAQQTNVINAIGTSLASPANASIRPISADQATDSVVNVLAPALAVSAANPGNNLNSNQTAVMVKNVIFTEIPLSYGHAFDFGAFGKLGVGGSFKVVNGRVYQSRVRLIENGVSVTSSDITSSFKDNYEQSTNVTIDLGTQWKYAEWLTLGLVAKNLTSPGFRSPELKDQKGRLVDENGTIGVSHRDADVKLKPQVRFGLGVTPLSWLSLASDIDLTENESILQGLDFKSRHLGAGVEASPFDWFKIRGGMYENVSATEFGPVATGGLSLGAPWLLFEVDFGYGLRSARYKERSYPRESRFQAQLVSRF